MEGRRGGRPRSETARAAVLAAVVDLVQEVGYAGLTMQGIAERAGVGKQTVYRWWESTAHVLLEALAQEAAILARRPHSDDVHRDVLRLLEDTAEALTPPAARLLAVLMAEAQVDERFEALFREGFLESRRQGLRELLLRASAEGRLVAGSSVDLLVDAALGALWYRVLSRHHAVDHRFAEQMAALLLPGDGDGPANSSPAT